ncbi:MAG TPA: D-glycerate dehydrogenase [Candidatus Hydrogenedentes bacterium]|nr:D-glycerate dehydrogenase [Candidatus Hydrogenedentota bacterium]HNT87677.1 D-glycerate dehydrogenase [Candidatus Hydrogenedentota bacterium]
MRVFVCRRLPESALAVLTDAFGEREVAVYPEDRVIPREDLLAAVRGVEALLPILTDRMDAEVMDAAGPQLKIIANYAVGFDNLDVPAATARGIAVTNTPDVLTETTADLAWALMMAAARRIGEGERYLRAGRWKSWAPMLLLGVDVYRKTLGVFGMGRIGQAVARRAGAFGMRVLYHDTAPLPPDAEAALGATFVDKTTLLRESDFISIHCPLTPETRHAFAAPEFHAMKATAVLVNTARGPVVDEAALADALRHGEIFAAGLDVFEREPAVHPDLAGCENAVLIPHLGSATAETRARMAEIAAANIIARLRGEIPPNCVNPEALSAQACRTTRK